MYFASLTYTSPTFLASMVNTIASLTFVMAIILRWDFDSQSHLISEFLVITRKKPSNSNFYFIPCRLEHLDIRNPRGLAKILGTLFSLAGVMIMTSCKGPVIRNLSSPLIHIGRNNLHENWTKGSILTVASCITWSIWYIMQVNYSSASTFYCTIVQIGTWINISPLQKLANQL